MKLITCTLLVSLVSTACAAASTILNIVGAASGTFPTSDLGKTGALVSSFNWGVKVPRDASGVITGRRQYDTLTITRVPSLMSITILNALSRNENLRIVTLTTTINQTVKRYTLLNASIVSYNEYFDAVNGALETFELSFSKVEVETGRNTFGDDVVVQRTIASAIPIPVASSVPISL